MVADQIKIATKYDKLKNLISSVTVELGGKTLTKTNMSLKPIITKSDKYWSIFLGFFSQSLCFAFRKQ